MKANYQIISNAVFSAIDAGQNTINLNDIEQFLRLGYSDKLNYLDYFKDRLNNSYRGQMDYSVNFSSFVLTITRKIG